MGLIQQVIAAILALLLIVFCALFGSLPRFRYVTPFCMRVVTEDVQEDPNRICKSIYMDYPTWNIVESRSIIDWRQGHTYSETDRSIPDAREPSPCIGKVGSEYLVEN